MQVTSKELYQNVSEEQNISFDVVKFVGDVVFKEWNDKLKDPQAIILKIKKLGRQYLRRNKLIEATRKLRTEIINSDEDIKSEDSFFRNEEKKMTEALYTKRIREYERYVSAKREIQKRRYPNQPILERIEDELD